MALQFTGTATPLTESGVTEATQRLHVEPPEIWPVFKVETSDRRFLDKDPTMPLEPGHEPEDAGLDDLPHRGPRCDLVDDSRLPVDRRREARSEGTWLTPFRYEALALFGRCDMARAAPGGWREDGRESSTDCLWLNLAAHREGAFHARQTSSLGAEGSKCDC